MVDYKCLSNHQLIFRVCWLTRIIVSGSITYQENVYEYEMQMDE